MMQGGFKVLLVSSVILTTAFAWHHCQDESFCQTLRSRSTSQFKIDVDTIVVDNKDRKVSATLVNTLNNQTYNFVIFVHANDVTRITIRRSNAEIKPIPSALLEDIKHTYGANIKFTVKEDQIVIYNPTLEITINIDDFTIISKNIHTNDIMLINGVKDMFVEDALALKVTFENMQNAYGIPEHGDNLKLKDTKNDEPYRHFNIDNPYYSTDSRDPLYGSVPVLYAHGFRSNKQSHVSGVFWNNPAQTFVDIDHSNNSITVDFITEAGTLDVFILPGGDFKSAVNNYVQLTGAAPLPPLFAMGYHQSRYS